jgi:hypothetical protein
MRKIILIILSLFLSINAFAGEKEPGFFPIPSDILNDIKGNLILTGAYGFPMPINDKKLVEVTSSAFGNVTATFD